MSTWTTLEADLTTSLSDYTRLADNREIEDVSATRVHKSYSLKPTGFDNRTLTSHSLVGSYKVALNIIYLNQTASARATNIDLFNSIKTDLELLPKFAGYVNEPTFIDIDKKHTKATLEFYYGLLEPYEEAMTQLDNLQAAMTAAQADINALETLTNTLEDRSAQHLIVSISQTGTNEPSITILKNDNFEDYGFNSDPLTWYKGRVDTGELYFELLSTSLNDPLQNTKPYFIDVFSLDPARVITTTYSNGEVHLHIFDDKGNRADTVNCILRYTVYNT